MRLLRVYHAAPEWQCARAGRILVTGCLLLTSATGYGADSVSPEQRLEHKGIEAEPSSHMTKRTNSETSTAHLASERTEAASGRGRSLSDGQTVGAAQGRVRKIVVSERVRAVGWVGLEGSGHHYMWAAIADMYETSGIDTLPSGNIGQLSLRRSMTAVGESEIRRLMKELADAEKSIKAPGTIVNLNIESFPAGWAPDKTLTYPDVRLIAEIAEEEGVDFRIVYLQRPARDILLSDLNHRHFENYNGRPSTKTTTEKMRHYSRVLFTNLGMMSAILRELDPGFIVCHNYDDLTNVKQATEIAEFVAPTAELASFYTASLLKHAHHSDHQEESFLFPDGDRVAKRLQKMFDSFESMYCST